MCSRPARNSSLGCCAHCGQIDTLHFDLHDSLVKELAQLSWPRLTKLSANSVSPSVAPLIASVSQLRELSLIADTVASFMALPDHCLIPLTRVYIEAALSSECLTRLRICPNLRALDINSFPSAVLWQQHGELLSRVLVSDRIDTSWEKLRRTPALEWLGVSCDVCPAPPTAVPLPRLRIVRVGTSGRRLSATSCLLLAHYILHVQPQIVELHLHILWPPEPTTDVCKAEIRQRIEDLITYALSHRLTCLTFASDREWPDSNAIRALPPVKYGWLKVSITVTK